VAAEFSGCAGEFCCSIYFFRTGSYAEAQRLFESFLARNELVASVRQSPDVFLARPYYILINPFRSPAIAASVRLMAPNFCMMLFT
jgi:hypothetical protein